MTAYRAGALEECLKLAAPLLRQPGIAPGVVLIAAQASAKLKRDADAARFYEQAAALHPREAPLLLVMAGRLRFKLHQNDAALDLLRRAEALRALDVEGLATMRRVLREQVALEECEARDAALRKDMLAGKPDAFIIDDPHEHLMWCDDERLNAMVRRLPTGKAFTPESRRNRREMPHGFGPRIRIGYLSNDVSDQHPTMLLFRGVLAAHDASRFDVTLFCHTDPDVAATDQGFRQNYPHLVPIHHLSDEAAAHEIRNRNIDILVDLKGHTKDVRVDLINSGLAPIQVAWLGFPGSSYGIDCDYMIGDPVVLPDGVAPFYHETICRLPECYQCNDAFTRPLPPALSRPELGLPDDAIIFASFNSLRKLNAPTLRAWARILLAVPDGVLWMMCKGDTPRRNITDFLARHGVDPARIIFTGRAGYAEHIARLQAADIALDSYPYNGHTTTSDALWAGLPVVARKGRNFASRVSESLLKALDVPELVADTPEAYERLAIDLAHDRARLAALKATIQSNRLTTPLFDTARFTRHLEMAFEMMVERKKSGLPPAPFDVPALPVIRDAAQ
ncbi:hypothetical protein ACQ3G6_07240 [Allorhizobium undicola]|uniref:O-linked N-acetylglucosamine transferase, SPINDLY family protein n=1 Tax=Allorhizobium undicola TaxID=78527 RepID=UPI003D337B06